MFGKNLPFTARRRNLLSANLIIAILIGVILLMTSYAYFPKEGFWHSLTHELGFALVVASTIWIAFEFFSHAETEEHWNERIEKISKNVFFGVYKRNLPELFVREANVLVIDQQFIRSGLAVTYTISDSSYVSRTGETVSFVKMTAIARYKIKNVSDGPAKYPVGVSLPNPMIDEIKSHCRVNRIAVKIAGKYVPYDLEEAEKSFRESLRDDSQFQCTFKVGEIDLEPGQEIEIIIDYVMAKEDEDTEIFQTRYPTDSLILTIMDRGPTRRVIRARAIHLADLENDTAAEAEGTYNFKLDRYLLPHQGFAIWWKKVPTGPSPAAAPPEPSSSSAGLPSGQ
ncbi:MAG TPA: hypothetical protein VHT03_09750 [Rhizomicrobium sp.]|jgi:hypothetical protein|nr:hypothetical protein [Rhizomicrobium sp.]